MASRIAAAVFASAWIAWCGVAHADWRSETGVFRIGVVVRGDRGGQNVDYKPAADAVSKAIGMPVEIIPMISYAALMDAQMASRIEYAVYSAAAFGTISALCECVTPLAAPVSEAGDTSTIAILATTSKKVKALEDLPAARLVWTGGLPASAALSSVTVKGAELTGEEEFAVLKATPEKAIEALRRKKADTVFGWAYAGPDGVPRAGTGTLAALAAAGIEYRTVWMSPPLRFGPHAVRKNVPQDIRDALRAFLTEGMSSTPEVAELLDDSFHARFEPVTDEDYAVSVEYAVKRKESSSGK